ncbi:hypothetical protein [Altererythrobacter litoralis]|uniref:DUF3618 domain-containing protein n=1 Tax=Altererythrobacter litoralis TaxID=3113904 RepID=A0ABU7GFR5_9SPHN|nr:hypothetical protein [Erythrobacteraceae bacterium 1XM1-14]
MIDLRRQLLEDKALRDTARSIITAQFDRVRNGLSGQRMGEQLAEEVGDETLDAADRASDALRGKGGIVAGVAAAVAGATALWFAREPLLEMFRSSDEDEAEEEPDDEADGG